MLLSWQTQAINREPSITRPIEIAANINIAQAVSPGISVNVPQQLMTLSWNDADQSFSPFSFLFDAWVNSSNPENFAVRAYLSGISMNCRTQQNNYFYGGLSGGAGAFTAGITGSHGFSDNWFSTDGGNNVISINASYFRDVAWSEDFQQEVPYFRGNIRITPPALTRESADGGASCSGIALLMFESTLV